MICAEDSQRTTKILGQWASTSESATMELWIDSSQASTTPINQWTQLVYRNLVYQSRRLDTSSHRQCSTNVYDVSSALLNCMYPRHRKAFRGAETKLRHSLLASVLD